MKQINAVKLFLVVALLSAVTVVNGQIHPLAFSNANGNNWYANYVGLRFEVTTPAVIAGDKQYTAAWSGATPWGAPVTTPIVNVPIIMDSTADSFGCSNFGPTVNMTGKIAVIWRARQQVPVILVTRLYMHKPQVLLRVCSLMSIQPDRLACQPLPLERLFRYL